MSRIRIDDLPPDADLTPEELEQIYGGAGRRSFRPSLEGLEGREMYAANLFVGLSQGGTLGVLGTPGDDIVALRRTGNQIEVLNGPEQSKAGSFAADKVRSINVLMEEGHDRLDLTGLGKLIDGTTFFNGLGTLETRYIDRAGRNTVDHWQSVKVDHRESLKLVSRDATTADGAKLHGEWRTGQWVENTDFSGSTSVLIQSRKDVFESPDGKLVSRKASRRDGAFVVGEWKGGQWVETTYFTDSPGPPKTRTDIFDKPDGNLLSSH